MADSPPLQLRAHNLLCLQGFRGRGYSESFVARMQGVHAQLASEPDTLVQVLTTPDALCEACPHLQGGCTLQGPLHEGHMRAQDLQVLERLALTPGQVLTWREILDRLAMTIGARDLPALCTTCPWLPLGWCAAGIDALHGSRAT